MSGRNRRGPASLAACEGSLVFADPVRSIAEATSFDMSRTLRELVLCLLPGIATVCALSAPPATSGATAGVTAREFAFVRGEAAGTEIYVIREDGQGLRRVTNSRLADYAPIWSPDGRRILFASNRDGDDPLYFMDASGRNVRRLTRNRSQASPARPRRT